MKKVFAHLLLNAAIT